MTTWPSADLETLATIGVAAVLITVLLLLWRWYRRAKARAALLAAVTGGAFEYLRDVLVPDGQGTLLHLDFLLLTARGAVIIDLRNVAGNIFGGDQMTEWTVMHRDRRTTFTNPQPGLYDRIAAVRALVNELPIDGRVVFRPTGRFPKGLPRHTLMLESLTAEYPAVDRQTLGPLLESWMPEWQRIRAACEPSSMVAPRAAI